MDGTTGRLGMGTAGGRLRLLPADAVSAAKRPRSLLSPATGEIWDLCWKRPLVGNAAALPAAGLWVAIGNTIAGRTRGDHRMYPGVLTPVKRLQPFLLLADNGLGGEQTGLQLREAIG